MSAKETNNKSRCVFFTGRATEEASTASEGKRAEKQLPKAEPAAPRKRKQSEPSQEEGAPAPKARQLSDKKKQKPETASIKKSRKSLEKSAEQPTDHAASSPQAEGISGEEGKGQEAHPQESTQASILKP